MLYVFKDVFLNLFFDYPSALDSFFISFFEETNTYQNIFSIKNIIAKDIGERKAFMDSIQQVLIHSSNDENNNLNHFRDIKEQLIEANHLQLCDFRRISLLEQEYKVQKAFFVLAVSGSFIFGLCVFTSLFFSA